MMAKRGRNSTTSESTQNLGRADTAAEPSPPGENSGRRVPTKFRPFKYEFPLTALEVDAEHSARTEHLCREEARLERIKKRIWKAARSQEFKERFGELTGIAVRLRRFHGNVVSPLQYMIHLYVPRKRTESERQTRTPAHDDLLSLQ